MEAPDSASLRCLNALRYLVLSYVTNPTTINAITDMPAKTPSPMGRTESFFPGRANAAVGVPDDWAAAAEPVEGDGEGAATEPREGNGEGIAAGFGEGDGIGADEFGFGGGATASCD